MAKTLKYEEASKYVEQALKCVKLEDEGDLVERKNIKILHCLILLAHICEKRRDTQNALLIYEEIDSRFDQNQIGGLQEKIASLAKDLVKKGLERKSTNPGRTSPDLGDNENISTDQTIEVAQNLVAMTIGQIIQLREESE